MITPDESIDILEKTLKVCPEITVAGIADPGDTLASDKALETFKKVKDKFPDLIKCMSTNGLLLYEKADEIIEVGIVFCDWFTIEVFSDELEEIEIDVFSAAVDFKLLKNSLDDAVQFAKDYIDSEEKEYCRMIDEYGRELEKEE